MKRRLISVSVILIWIGVAYGQQGKVIDKIIELGKTDNRTMHHLDVITNRFGGRLVGSDAYNNAAQWCASEFRKWGMDVIVDEAGTVPVGFDRLGECCQTMEWNYILRHLHILPVQKALKEVRSSLNQRAVRNSTE
jgi:hypothetical protein